ncbi:MAG: hypothetical protein NTY02_19530 [Acidobacteria bacterium]|nr:hypothetical protein [Acidobacteriota bacterium]
MTYELWYPKAIITLRKHSTGQVVSGIDDWTIYDWFPSNGSDIDTLRFEWEENNYACDDNREHFFYDSLGLPRPEPPDEHACMRIGPHKDYEYELLSIEPIP